jgi:uncharacterized membrane protein YphA (DoxX/SURF4 family)
MTSKWKNGLILFLRIGFGLLLIFAAIAKIKLPLPFARAVANYRVFGEGLSYWSAVFIPYLEIIMGLLLISGIWLDAAITLNALLMSTFLILVIQAYARGLNISCGCFSVDDPTAIGIIKIGQNVVFAGLATLLWVLYYQNKNKFKVKG